jgi:tRNA modification GTPase
LFLSDGQNSSPEVYEKNMYHLKDTIIAVSSPTSDKRVIIRISGQSAIDLLRQFFDGKITGSGSGLVRGRIRIDDELEIDAVLYLFLAPFSYTGETLAEIHLSTNSSAVEMLIGRLLQKGLRLAEPGEFTARAYLNGKIDLVQAEAVNEVITSSNEYQLNAAEKLLAGRLVETTAKAAADVMNCLTLIEAGLDFSGEDVEFITRPEAVDRLTAVKARLEQLLSGAISYESVVDLPAVGIAGVPNAGKSSLLNALLGQARSIVSEQRKTTRDVLSGLLELPGGRCVCFDCAGLIAETENVLDELARQASVEALHNSVAVIYCVDISKTDWQEDIAAYEFVKAKTLIPAATKSDLLSEGIMAEKITALNRLFDNEFIAVSAKSGAGIELLRDRIAGVITQAVYGSKLQKPNVIALTARHRQAVAEAVKNIDESVGQLQKGSDEIAAMMLRSVYQGLSDIRWQNIDERILEGIFEKFCIGK